MHHSALLWPAHRYVTTSHYRYHSWCGWTFSPHWLHTGLQCGVFNTQDYQLLHSQPKHISEVGLFPDTTMFLSAEEIFMKHSTLICYESNTLNANMFSIIQIKSRFWRANSRSPFRKPSALNSISLSKQSVTSPITWKQTTTYWLTINVIGLQAHSV
jgi:hypothetical protein